MLHVFQKYFLLKLFYYFLKLFSIILSTVSLQLFSKQFGIVYFGGLYVYLNVIFYRTSIINACVFLELALRLETCKNVVLFSVSLYDKREWLAP